MFHKAPQTYLFKLFWFLVVYIFIGLGWWCIILVKQNDTIYDLQMQHLNDVHQNKNTAQYHQEYQRITQKKHEKMTQFYGECITFFVFFVVSSLGVYQLLQKSVLIYKKEQHFLLGITHELKTPITTILLNLETLHKRQCSPDIQTQLLKNSIEEILRLNVFYDNIMTSTQLDEGYQKGKFDVIEMHQTILLPLYDYFKKKYLHYNFKIQCNTNKTLVFGDKTLLELCFHNLLDNALKYSQPHTTITIDIKEHNTHLCVSVCDEGIGIGKQDKKDIFNKFYRIPSAATQQQKGSGLGLYVVEKIVRLHRAKIVVEDNTPQGTIFKILFFNEHQKKNIIS